MERLHFGARARRRARFKRVTLWAWIVSLVAAFAGIPGSMAALDLVDRFAGDNRPRVIPEGTESSESTASLLRFRQGVFDLRPTPSPTVSQTPEPEPETAPAATPAAAPAGSIPEIIYAAAAEFGVEGGYLLSVAQCESGLDPNAFNPVGYHGLFQFDHQTWGATGYADIYDPVAQARTAARLIAAGEASRWPNCA